MTAQKIPVLFAEKNSVYNKIPSVDIYDEERNALTYFGNSPIVAHPPCRLFSRLRKFSTAHPGEKYLAYHSVNLIRRNGGILEHPAYSSLWKEKGLPLGNLTDRWSGFTLSIDQHWFGHPCRKNTWLYIVGIPKNQLPVYPLNFQRIEFCINSSSSRSALAELPKSLRSSTPLLLAQYLVNLAFMIKEKKEAC